MKENSILFQNNKEINYEIRCPKCCYLILIDLSENPNSYNLVISCENCGKSEIPIEEFESIMIKNNTKTCKYCCKNFEAREMLISEKHNNLYLCPACYQFLKNNNEVNEINEFNYIFIKDLGKNCRNHKNEKNIFFCVNCNKHICQECKKAHENHNIKNIIEEAKSKNEIGKLNQICKEENENLIKEKNFYYDILSNMKRKFEKIKKNNEDMLELKKLIFDIYDSNSHNYGVYKYSSIITSEKGYGISDEEIKKINSLIDNITIKNSNYDNNLVNNIFNNRRNSNNNSKNKSNINNKNSEQKEYEDKKYSKSVIKQSKKSINNINLGNDKSKHNQTKNNNKYNDKTRNNNRYNYGGSISTIKTSKNKRKSFMMGNDMINREIQNNSNYFRRRINDDQDNNDNFQVLKKLSNSIVMMLFLGDNKILINVFSRKNDLILGEIKKGKNIIKNELISLELLPVSRQFDKPINYMELCEDGSILSCSDDQLIKFNLIDKSIQIHFHEKIEEEEKKPIISCTFFSKNELLILCSPNLIHLYEKGNKEIITFEIDTYKIISMKKVSSQHLILVGQKIESKNKNKIWLLVLKLFQNEMLSIYERELNINVKYEKIIIENIYENVVVVSYPGKGFFIYDYLTNHILNNISCGYIPSLKIEKCNENSAYCYVVETKYEEGKNIEEIKLKKYLIEKNYIRRSIEITSKEIKTYNLNTKKAINDMCIINENNGSLENGKKMVLLGDNEGNILYNFC